MGWLRSIVMADMPRRALLWHDEGETCSRTSDYRRVFPAIPLMMVNFGNRYTGWRI